MRNENSAAKIHLTDLFLLIFPVVQLRACAAQASFHRDTIHGDVSCRRHDHIALADVRCVVTAGLDGIASLRLLCFLLKTMELAAIFILTDLVQWYNSQM